MAITRDVFGLAYGASATYNSSSHVWTLPTDSYFEIGMLADQSDYQRYQGRSFSLLLIDEAGQWPDLALLDLLRSNLRGPEGVPVRVVMAANPGGVAHQTLAQRYVFKSTPWTPFQEEKSGREWVSCPSTFSDNPNMDREGYRQQIEAATATDPELGRAWLVGDWTVARGAFFGAVLSEDGNCVDPWPLPEHAPEWWAVAYDFGWRFELAYDHGSAAPAVCYLIARSPGGPGPDERLYSRDSIIAIDELATNEPGSTTHGMEYTVPHVADQIKELAQRWGMERADGVADDAIFSQHGSQAGSIGDEFRRCGVYFRRAGKGSRTHGWEKMRRLLADAGKPDVPGLYISRSSEYFWATVPYLPRDPRRPDDVDSRAADHAADAIRYGVTSEPSTCVIVPIFI